MIRRLQERTCGYELANGGMNTVFQICIPAKMIRLQSWKKGDSIIFRKRGKNILMEKVRT